MKMHLLEQQGKLFYTVAKDYTGFSDFEGESIDDTVQTEQVLGDDQFERTFIKGHKQAITSLEWMQDNRSVITGAKDCCLIRCKSKRIKVYLYRGLGDIEEALLQRREVQQES